MISFFATTLFQWKLWIPWWLPLFALSYIKIASELLYTQHYKPRLTNKSAQLIAVKTAILQSNYHVQTTCIWLSFLHCVYEVDLYSSITNYIQY